MEWEGKNREEVGITVGREEKRESEHQGWELTGERKRDRGMLEEKEIEKAKEEIVVEKRTEEFM